MAYPSEQPTPKNNIHYAKRFDEICKKRLEKGEKVLLNACELGSKETSDVINFYPLYWSLTFFPGQGKNTIGMIVRDKHPAFGNFPTDSYSDWQWQHIYKDARAFYINHFQGDYRPMAQPVDDFHRNNKLASIFELKIGKGKLLVCGFNVDDQNNSVARQLKSSLLDYMNSDDFNPDYELDIHTSEKMFTYIEPLKSVVPVEFSNTLLYIECASMLEDLNTNKTWNIESDKYEARKNTTYAVIADGIWKDEKGHAWHGKDMTLNIQTPRGFVGSLYLFFHDWNSNGRERIIQFEGREYGLGQHDKDGIWVKLHVMREDSNDGQLVLKTKNHKGPNLMLSKIALVEE